MFSSYTCWGQYLHSVSKKVYLTKAASNVFGNRDIKWFIIRIYSIFLCQFSCFSNTKEVSTLCEMHITYCSAYMLQYFKIHFILTLRDTIKHVHNKFSTCKQENEGPCSPDGKDFLNNWATEIFLRSVLSTPVNLTYFILNMKVRSSFLHKHYGLCVEKNILGNICAT